MAAIGAGDVVVILAVDGLSRDTTDLLVIARDLQMAGTVARHTPPALGRASRKFLSESRRAVSFEAA